MKFFNWGGDDSTAEAVSSADTGNIPIDAVASARAKVDTAVSNRKQRKTSADKESFGSDQQVIQAEIAKQLEACYEPSAWSALLALPADAALALTAREYWKISRDERQTLGAAGSAAARTLMITNPRALAFLMLGSALFSIYVPRAIQEVHHYQEKRKNDAEKSAHKQGA
jgi:methionyl-tRNA synthetase